MLRGKEGWWDGMDLIGYFLCKILSFYRRFSFASIMFLHARFGFQPGRFEELFQF